MPWESRIKSERARQTVIALLMGLIFTAALLAAWALSRSVKESSPTPGAASGTATTMPMIHTIHHA